MRPLARRTLIALGVIFLAIQAVPVARDNPPVDPGARLQAPPEVAALLRRACMDCHSRETRWPRYAHVAPASWLVARDVKEGREKLDLSAWNTWSPGRQAHKLEEIRTELEDDEMPPWFYLPLHPEAQLSASERGLIVSWTRQATGGGDASPGGEEHDGDESGPP